MQDLLKELEEVLSRDQSLMSNGRLFKSTIMERSSNMDPKFLEMLLSSDSIKKHFFTNMKDTLVFDKSKFQEFISNKNFLPDSYTAFANSIGLATDSGHLKAINDVVLAWPYKDCVLEGGMSKEESATVRENFLSVTLAPDDITRLLESKVLTSWKRWDAKAVKTGRSRAVKTVTDKDNLIIKGNSLLALHSLEKKFAGKVKLIYIDPPYNTCNDSFRYNDKFSQSDVADVHEK